MAFSLLIALSPQHTHFSEEYIETKSFYSREQIPNQYRIILLGTSESVQALLLWVHTGMH
jgi:hypothetical protein